MLSCDAADESPAGLARTPLAARGAGPPAVEAVASGPAIETSPVAEPAAVPPRLLDEAVLPAHLSGGFTGDLPALREQGVLRALVTLSRTDFFLETGRPLGLHAESLERFEAFLNQRVGRRERKLKVVYVPVPFEELIPALLDGRGDIAVGFLTITPERERRVAFASGRALSVDEVVVARKGVEGLSTLDDLAGRSVYVLRGSSYAENLRALGRRLRAQGREPIDIVEADPHLLTEDLLELVNAGVLDLTVADDFRARLWARVLPALVVRDDLVVHRGGHVGWAVRPDNPKLLEATNDFLRSVRKGTLVGNVLFKRYYDDTRWLENPISEEKRRRLQRYAGLFRKYADRYGFDWLAIAAQAYQESGLDHGRRSRRGAVGLMQVLPGTAADPKVAIPDVSDLESNVHAGVKYLALLRDDYFDDPELSEEERMAFSWAAYNAGPSKVRRMRRRARAMGLDGDRWFGNVEHAALDMVGREPVRYVANVYKYWVAYRLATTLAESRTAANLPGST
jgi:membrane-bound lytic murein transglycosylase MltF